MLEESPVLKIPDYNLDKLRLLDRISFRYRRGNFSTGSNNLSTAHTFNITIPGWYLWSLSYSSGDSSTGTRAILYDSAKEITMINITGGTDEYTGGQRWALYYNEVGDVLVQYSRLSSTGGYAKIRALTSFGLLISDDPEA